MVKINWTSQSKSDLVTIAEYIAEDSPKYAGIQVKRLENGQNN
jgi:toxin ParE1/3/4